MDKWTYKWIMLYICYTLSNIFEYKRYNIPKFTTTNWNTLRCSIHIDFGMTQQFIQHTLVESLNNILELYCFSMYTTAPFHLSTWYHTQMVEIPSISNMIKVFNMYQLWKLSDDSCSIQFYSLMCCDFKTKNIVEAGLLIVKNNIYDCIEHSFD